MQNPALMDGQKKAVIWREWENGTLMIKMDTIH